MLLSVTLNKSLDYRRWKFTRSGKFSVKSMYNHMFSSSPDRSFKPMWKAKIPLKIKIWLWLIWHNAIATKDNMKKRNWVGDYSCSFYESDESIHHLFFACSAASYMWSTICNTFNFYDRPTCFTQYFTWIADKIPSGINLHIIGVAAFCWVLWNKACFD